MLGIMLEDNSMYLHLENTKNNWETRMELKSKMSTQHQAWRSVPVRKKSLISVTSETAKTYYMSYRRSKGRIKY